MSQPSAPAAYGSQPPPAGYAGYPQGGYSQPQGGYPAAPGGYPEASAPGGAYPPVQGGGMNVVDTPTYQGVTPEEDVADDPNAAAPGASAPPLEKVGAVQGYNNITFDSDYLAPPPSYDESMTPPQPEARPPPNIPVLTEEQAKDALTTYVSENCCYGSGVVKNMIFRDIQSTSAYHYKLESFCESRSTVWAYEPYRGGPVDSAMNGPAPAPWDISVSQPSERFKNAAVAMPVPHTASVMPCHTCFGLGRNRCHRCLGRGRVRCNMCHGSGRVHHAGGGHHHGGHHGSGGHGHGHGHHGGHHGGHGPNTTRCNFCDGFGRKRCVICHGHGLTICNTCQAAGQLKCYIKLNVKWTNHADDRVIDRQAVIPGKLIQDVSGQVALREENIRVWPVQNFPEMEINNASRELVGTHSTKFPNERMLAQRQVIRIIPVTAVIYTYKDKDYTFHVYGFEHKVFHPDYPQKCCCIIL